MKLLKVLIITIFPIILFGQRTIGICDSILNTTNNSFFLGEMRSFNVTHSGNSSDNTNISLSSCVGSCAIEICVIDPNNIQSCLSSSSGLLSINLAGVYQITIQANQYGLSDIDLTYPPFQSCSSSANVEVINRFESLIDSLVVSGMSPGDMVSRDLDISNDVYNEIFLPTQNLLSFYIDQGFGDPINLPSDGEQLILFGNYSIVITANNPGQVQVGYGDVNGYGLKPPIIISGALPVNLMSFLYNSSYEKLEWKIENADNFSHFELQNYNIQTSEFQRKQIIQYVEDQKIYTSEKVESGLYRLKLLDYDGLYFYSNIVNIGQESLGSVLVYPNPATNYIRFEGNELWSVSRFREIMIIGQNGHFMKKAQVLNEFIDVSDLNNGTYYLVINGNDGLIFETKFVILR